MTVDKNIALSIWRAAFGSAEWAQDCFGTWMNVHAYSNEIVSMRRPGYGCDYDYSWNIDHIRPISSFENENDANFRNNFEPVHRQNNLQKLDNFPGFKINEESYNVVKTDNYYGYGIKDSNGNRIDWKAKTNKYYEE